MKKILIAILLFTSSSFAENLSEGKYLLIKHNSNVQHQKVCEVEILKKDGAKFITMVDGNFNISSSLKITEQDSGDFIAVKLPEKSLPNRDMEMIMFSAKRKPRQNVWVCSLATFDSSGHLPIREIDKFLLYQLNSADGKAEE